MADMEKEQGQEQEQEQAAGKKVTAKDKKWGVVGGGMFVGEPLVDLYIPEDPQNKVKEKFVCINGEQIWLGVEKELKVPKSVADLYNYSHRATRKAEKDMSQEIEIKA